MTLSMIAAIGRNNELGKNNDLIWHLDGDLPFFKKVTMGKPVIMGRTTYFSLPIRPLPGRRNIVLNLGGDPIPDDVVCVNSFEEAFAAAEPAPRCFVMGGASVYRQAIDSMDRLFITHVHTTIPEADAHFPEINSDIWAVESRSGLRTDSASGLSFEFVVYTRRKNCCCCRQQTD